VPKGAEYLELPIFYADEIKERNLKIEPRLSENAKIVLKARYLKKNAKDVIIETYKEMFHRVAKTIAYTELQYGSQKKIDEYVEKFYNLMASLDFLPNSPTLMNAGRDEGQLSACFVLPVGDSMPEIFESVKMAALIQKSGGGVGYSFSRLRPAGDRVKTTNGVSSGPISFMKVFNEATETVKQGGRRRGANMGVLRVDHPDILEFISSKLKDGRFANFNISVGITDAFMEALKNGAEYDLINPRGGVKEGSLKSQRVWDEIINNAWENAEPGILFLDRINRNNPTPDFGRIESTNPCGEACLLPYEACNLGSINLSHFIHNKAIDFARLGDTIKLAVRYLDNVIDANEYVPLVPKIKQTTKGNRKIGLGVMGFADMLISLGISYNDDLALKIADKVMSFISSEGRKASMELARERGCFPNWEKSIFFPDTPIRNATITSIAPTGSLSIIAGCSPGIEPLFGVCFERNVLDKEKLLEIHPLFEKIATEENFYSEDLMNKISGIGTIQGVMEIPAKFRKLFITSYDIPGERHVLMQAAFQRSVDMSVSKTINLPSNSTKEDVDRIYHLAYESGLKGMTVYRYGSRQGQVIVLGDSTRDEDREWRGKSDEVFIGDAPEESSLGEMDNTKSLSLSVENMDNIEEKISAGAEAFKNVKISVPGLSGGNGKNHGKITDIPAMFSNEISCPECGQGTIAVGACSVCQHCGYSKCG